MNALKRIALTLFVFGPGAVVFYLIGLPEKYDPTFSWWHLTYFPWFVVGAPTLVVGGFFLAVALVAMPVAVVHYVITGKWPDDSGGD